MNSVSEERLSREYTDTDPIEPAITAVAPSRSLCSVVAHLG